MEMNWLPGSVAAVKFTALAVPRLGVLAGKVPSTWFDKKVWLPLLIITMKRMAPVGLPMLASGIRSSTPVVVSSGVPTEVTSTLSPKPVGLTELMNNAVPYSSAGDLVPSTTGAAIARPQMPMIAEAERKDLQIIISISPSVMRF